MKKIISVCLMIMIVLTGCTVGASDENLDSVANENVSLGKTESMIDDLLTKDYIMNYYWNADMLPTIGNPTEDGYYQVDPSSGFSTLADLKNALAEIYVDSTAQSMMDSLDEMGNSRFIDRDGKLYKSDSSILKDGYWNYDEKSIRILSEDEENISYSVNVCHLETEESFLLEGSVVQTENGWRMTLPLSEMAEMVSTEKDLKGPYLVAEQFVTALRENDVTTIALLSGEKENTYRKWKGMQIPICEITDTLEEYDGYGRYRVHMKVVDAFSVFEKGNKDYILIVSEEQESSGPVVCYFEPEDTIAYNYSSKKDDEACLMAVIFLQSEGGMKCQGTNWLSQQVVTDYAIALLNQFSPAEEYSEEEVKNAANRYLGIGSFTPDTAYLTGDGAYYYPAKNSLLNGQFLIWPSHIGNGGKVTVKAELYSDHLKTTGYAGYLFTFNTNSDGSYQLVSIK